MKNKFLQYLALALLVLSTSTLNSFAAGVTYGGTGSSDTSGGYAAAWGTGSTATSDVTLDLTMQDTIALGVAPNGSSTLPSGAGSPFDGIPAQMASDLQETTRAGMNLYYNGPHFVIAAAVYSNTDTISVQPSDVEVLTLEHTAAGSEIDVWFNMSLFGDASIGSVAYPTSVDTSNASGVRVFVIEGYIEPTTFTSEDRAGLYQGTFTITASVI